MNYDRLLQLGGIDREVPPIPGYITKEQLQGEIDGINVLIPEEASDENQLADKQYVNTKVSTDSATFKGTYNSVSDLQLTTAATHSDIATALGTTITGADNNDYCYVQVPVDTDTPTRIASTDRYKFNGTAWAYEYSLGDTSMAPYRQFKNSWHTDTTLLQFCQDIASDSSVLVGDLFLGSLTCSGLPAGMLNGEVAVQVNQGLNGKLLLLTITSTNLGPYHWEQSYYNNTLYGWKSSLNNVDEGQLFANTVPTELKKQAAIMQVLMLEQMYGYEATTVQNPEYVSVIVDSEDKIIAGKNVNGDVELFGTVYE